MAKRCLVFVPGMCCNATHFSQKFLKLLKERYDAELFLVTLPFHETSQNKKPDPQLGRLSLLDYKKFVQEKIKEHSCPVILVGHSMGGLICQMVAADPLSNQQVEGLILLTPALPAGFQGFTLKSTLFLLPPFLASGLFNRPYTLKRQARFIFLNDQPGELQKELPKNLVYESGKVIWEFGAFWTRRHWQTTRVDLQNITQPTLIIASRKDRVIPFYSLRRLAKRISHSTFVEFPGDHWVIGDFYAEEISRQLAAWLIHLKPTAKLALSS